MLIIVLSIFVFGITALSWVYFYSKEKLPVLAGQTQVRVFIPKGSSFVEIKNILAESGLIEDDPRFAIVARLTKLSHRMQAGEFMLTAGQTPEELLLELANAKLIQHKITVFEGRNYNEIAEIICVDDICDESEFVSLASDKDFIKSLGIKADTLEGYLFPDTYHLAYDQLNAKSIIERMVQEFQKNWDGLQFSGRNERVKDISLHQIVTMASLVEEEAVNPGEQPIIAGVFYNRLGKGMRLQSDPTSIYGRVHEGPITRADVRTVTPYNTYVIKGLPPGPISNPGLGAIKSSLWPEKHNYYYFVSNNDGSHSFSKNLREHNRAVARYKKKLRLAKQKKNNAAE